MIYTLDTEIHFLVALGRNKQEETKTIRELGFTQENLDDYTNAEIESEIQEIYQDWEQNYLDSGWSVKE